MNALATMARSPRCKPIVANFFILPGELVAGDFSRVAFTWDCG